MFGLVLIMFLQSITFHKRTSLCFNFLFLLLTDLQLTLTRRSTRGGSGNLAAGSHVRMDGLKLTSTQGRQTRRSWPSCLTVTSKGHHISAEQSKDVVSVTDFCCFLYSKYSFVILVSAMFPRDHDSQFSEKSQMYKSEGCR